MKQIMEGFPDVKSFIQASEGISPATIRKLREILTDTVKKVQLKMELAVVIDAGEPFVKGTYNLEGDGAMVLTTYEELVTIKNFIEVPNFPNLTSCASAMAKGNSTVEQQLVRYAKSCVQPGFNYYTAKFEGELKPLVSLFKVAWVFSPLKLKDTQVSTSTVDELVSTFPFLNTPSNVNGLKSELPTYMTPIEDINPSTDIIEWWFRHKAILPNWHSAFEKVLLIQPSSATVKRAFSLLQNSFSNKQSRSLEDYIETSVMLQYNNRS